MTAKDEAVKYFKSLNPEQRELFLEAIKPPKNSNKRLWFVFWAVLIVLTITWLKAMEYIQ